MILLATGMLQEKIGRKLGIFRFSSYLSSAKRKACRNMAKIVNKYPVGIQTFEKIRENGYLYIDKTQYIVDFREKKMSYIFLSRPRRFGKSLFASTLQAYFEGRKELFEGLAIADYEKDWVKHPVLHFDLSGAKHFDADALNSYLNLQLLPYEELYGKGEGEKYPNERLDGVVRRAYKQTGEKVVVIIDEYDAPLLDVVHEKDELKQLRLIMQNFYSPLKKLDPYLEFIFITGITKFSQLSIFSELNNIQNISMLPEYATICGITEEEMATQMDEDLDILAKRMGISREEAIQKLKYNYDGYHFTWPSPDIYNPFSLLNAFVTGRLDSYWFGSGTPMYLIEMLRKYGVLPSKIGGNEAMAEEFDAPTERMASITPLLYQSGYVTIKNADTDFGIYRLDIPNKEVRIGLMRSLLPYYVTPDTLTATTTIVNLARALVKGDMEGMLQLLQTFLSTVPYCDHTDYESHYQQMLYIIFSLLGMYVDVEVRTPKGRVDMVMRTATTLYIVELKLNQSAEAAMQQIDLKNYPERFALCGLPVVKVGINFDMERHTLKDWMIG